MEKQKALELEKLADEFANKFKEIVNVGDDAALVMCMRIDKGDTTHSTAAVIGTRYQCLLATHKLDEQTNIITEYNVTHAAMAINDMMSDILSGNHTGGDKPSTNSNAPGDESCEHPMSPTNDNEDDDKQA